VFLGEAVPGRRKVAGFEGRELAMDLKSRQGRAKARKRIIDSSARCITCNKTCSMSGLCMKHWPEFEVDDEKGDTDDDKNIKKSS
jgi:hypothetical protein